MRIAAGVYMNAEGVIEDLQPECDAVRIHTKNGTAYCFREDLMRIPMPMQTLPSGKRNAITKK